MLDKSREIKYHSNIVLFVINSLRLFSALRLFSLLFFLCFNTSGSQDDILSESYKYLHDGNLEAAKSSLEKILVATTAEIRHKLWAWKALRQLGEIPPSNSRDRVRGVVFEIPVKGLVDTLAAYSDGRVRYLNGKLGVSALLIWEDTENLRIKPLVTKVMNSAQSLVGKTPALDRHNERDPNVEPRISVLTYGGLYTIDGNPNNSYLTDPVLSTGTQLFTTLMKITQQR